MFNKCDTIVLVVGAWAGILGVACALAGLAAFRKFWSKTLLIMFFALCAAAAAVTGIMLPLAIMCTASVDNTGGGHVKFGPPDAVEALLISLNLILTFTCLAYALFGIVGTYMYFWLGSVRNRVENTVETSDGDTLVVSLTCNIEKHFGEQELV